MASSKKRLDSGIDAEKEKLAQVTGQQSHDILGIGVTYVVGAEWSALTPRDWLLDQMEDIGLPEYIAPPQPTERKAFSRTIEHMTKFWLDSYTVEAPRDDNGVEEPHMVEVEVRDGERKRFHHITANVFFDEDESGSEGGEWRQFQLGDVFYDGESKQLVARSDDALDKSNHLYEVWEDVSSTAREFFEMFQQTHTATDIRESIYKVANRYTNTVIKLQRGVYLFPPALAGLVDDLAELFSRVNEEYKERGEPLAIRTFEVLDTEEKQEWVEARVRQKVGSAVDDAVGEALQAFDEGDAAHEAVDSITGALDDEMLETATVYNGILEAEISIENELEAAKTAVTEEAKEDIVDSVIEELEAARDEATGDDE